MAQRVVVFIVLATFLALAFGAVDKQEPQPPPKTTTSATTTTDPTTTTPSTTTSPTTTTPSTTTSPTTTTTPSTTTSPTTTTTPSTTTSPTTTTTPSTTTTSTEAPTTPAPKPSPKPEMGMWKVVNSTTNITCIIANMAIQLNVSYPTSDNKIGIAIINVPGNDTTAMGQCGNSTQTMTLSWMGRDTAEDHTLTFTFDKNDTSKHFKLSHIVVKLMANDTEFPNITKFTKMELHNDNSEFSTSVGMSYHCSKTQGFNLTQVGSNMTSATIHVSKVQLEPFHGKSDDKFNAAEDCEHSNTPDIVPIAVGCALVGLVAIVLIAYLVGRRRSQARGYLSM